MWCRVVSCGGRACKQTPSTLDSFVASLRAGQTQFAPEAHAATWSTVVVAELATSCQSVNDACAACTLAAFSGDAVLTPTEQLASRIAVINASTFDCLASVHAIVVELEAKNATGVVVVNHHDIMCVLCARSGNRSSTTAPPHHRVVFCSPLLSCLLCSSLDWLRVSRNNQAVLSPSTCAVWESVARQSRCVCVWRNALLFAGICRHLCCCGGVRLFVRSTSLLGSDTQNGPTRCWHRTRRRLGRASRASTSRTRRTLQRWPWLAAPGIRRRPMAWPCSCRP